MRNSIPGIARWVVAAGVVFILGAQTPAFAKKGAKISVADDPSIKDGSPEIVLVEVSDFQCPGCGGVARDVLPAIHEKFVRTGKIELIYLDYPLRMHPHAFKAAEAAQCANDQKMFWEMHSQLFGNQKALAPEQLPGHAKEIGLDVDVFQKCLSSGRQAGKIREDLRVVQNLGITKTPSYVLARRLPNSEKVEVLEVGQGWKAYAELEEKLNALLSAK
jgi:protein-disulfide isomerase